MSDYKLQERALLAPAVAGDRLALADGVLLAALDGSRPLAPAERRALQASPLTLRRFKQLALQRRGAAGQPANDAWWERSPGMLRAAASSAALEQLATDDGHWMLHFVADDSGHWQLILQLDAEAPFAGRMLRERPLLRVVDGGGAILLQGRLDADGECERPWPFELAPLAHFQLYGATFAIEPCR